MMNDHAPQTRAPYDVKSLLAKWITIATAYARAHREESIGLKRRHTLIGAPSVGLSAVVGTTIFASMQEATQSTDLKWFLAVLSMGAAALAALVTFYNYAERSVAHRIASEEYTEIARRLELLKTSITTMVPNDWRNILEGYSQRLEAIGRRVDLPKTMVLRIEVDHLITPTEGTRRGTTWIDGSPKVVRRRYPTLPREGFPEELEQVFLHTRKTSG